MAETSSKEWLQWICSSQNFDELSQNYDQWADQYESDTSSVWEPVPKAAAEMLSTHLKGNRKATILDIGAGTGLVGVALAELGFDNIVGMDISARMLAKAAQKGVYKALVCCSLSDQQENSLGIFSQVTGVVATGVFAERHAGVTELAAVQTRISPGGIFVFTARQSFLPELRPVLEREEWTSLDSQVMPIYDDPMHLLAFKIDA